MTIEKIIDYVNLKLTKLGKEKNLMLDLMLKLENEHDEHLRIEYLKAVYAFQEVEDIITFIETGVLKDESKKRK